MAFTSLGPEELDDPELPEFAELPEPPKAPPFPNGLFEEPEPPETFPPEPEPDGTRELPDEGANAWVFGPLPEVVA
jgi:hypothetical protein